MVKIVIAPDKFKGTLTAAQVAEHLSAGIRASRPDAQILAVPVADGGDGLLDTFVAAGFELVPLFASGADGAKRPAAYARSGQRAVIELAAIAGLAQLDDRRLPLSSSSQGLGEAIAAALDAGCAHILIGIGGSASTDGGAGMLQALGARLADEHGDPIGVGAYELSRLATIDISGLHPGLSRARIEVACDVDNPLMGPHGAAWTYGPQKGATEAQVLFLDAVLARWADVLADAVGADHRHLPGTGAAGGAGFGAAAAFGAVLRPGIEIVLEMLRFDETVSGADLVLTGEGLLDVQTLHGKVAYGVAAAARSAGVPVHAVVGRSTLDPDVAGAAGFEQVHSLTEDASLEEAMRSPGALLETIGERIGAQFDGIASAIGDLDRRSSTQPDWPAASSDAIVPFRVEIAEEKLADLRERLQRVRWPERETVDDWSQGVPLNYLQDLCEYWSTSYDWRTAEARLNSFPQYTTEIDGVSIHFLHVRSPEPDALPVVLSHGWPGSVTDFMKVIEPLADPRSHGGDPADALHIVCPSLPGYGFSGKPTATGWSCERIARAWITLMDRLGYSGYGAQGGDWGSVITSIIAMLDQENCVGIHVNRPVVDADPNTMDDLTDAERHTLERYKVHQSTGTGYSLQQATRPQTLGYALADSPVGQAAWVIEKLWAWSDCDGDLESIYSRDELLDTVMMYWLTESATSSARLYWETRQDATSPVAMYRRDGEGYPGITVPTAISIFPQEHFAPSRRWVEQRYTNIVHWNELKRGGHFPASEQPALFVDELRASFRAIRSARAKGVRATVGMATVGP
jgi:glycerate kinase